MRRSALHYFRFVALGLVVAAVLAPGARADAGCTKYASPNGDDTHPGTLSQPMKSPIALLNSLSAGQTGCLQDNSVFIVPGEGFGQTQAAGSPGQPITLRPATPGARATIDSAWGFVILVEAHDIVLRDLNIRRHDPSVGGSLFRVDGDRVTAEGLDLTYPKNICLDVGEDVRDGFMNPTEDFILRRSRIHDCGSEYGGPNPPNDSGVHGIYLQFLQDGADADANGAIIEDNLIYRNNNRGIQLYPNADDVLIQFNVLDHNGANLNLGSDQGFYSQRNRIENNILTDSTLSGLQAGGFVGDTSEVLGYGYQPAVDYGNQVIRNCISNQAHPGELYEGNGFTQSQNIENQPPQYQDENFRLAADSPCAGKGPRPQPTFFGGYPRPRGATPLRASLVPAFRQCTTPNSVHGAPDFPGGTNPDQSCKPPVQGSSYLTVGAPDANSQPANALGSVTLTAVPDNPATPAEDADLLIATSLTDVRKKSDLTDYTGEVQTVLRVRLTDRVGTPSGDVPQTTQDFTFSVTVPCTSTPATTVGSTCSLTAGADSLRPGAITASLRSIWALDKVQVFDGGADNDADSLGDNTLFETQGVFAP
jgi:hypothetical protein